jgi:hypothetical protein
MILILCIGLNLKPLLTTEHSEKKSNQHLIHFNDFNSLYWLKFKTIINN